MLHLGLEGALVCLARGQTPAETRQGSRAWPGLELANGFGKLKPKSDPQGQRWAPSKLPGAGPTLGARGRRVQQTLV